ncbi:MAG: hypothetical protein QOG71_3915 [Pyrinomonadaceae bacterium]|nr:hypothetical protein [Pyrinomonadaceae bacterium]
MSLHLSVKSLTVGIKRLQATARKGSRHCPHCREERYHSSWLDPLKPSPRPEDLITVKCEFCHTEYVSNMAGMPEYEREIYRLLYSITLEDLYRDPKAHATFLWIRHWASAKRKRAARRAPPGDTANERIKLDSGTRRRIDKLSVESANLFTKKHRMLKSKYGGIPFPEHQDLVNEVRSQAKGKWGSPSPAGVEELEDERIAHLICAALEKIIWGEMRSDTQSAIERIEREIEELIKEVKVRKSASAEHLQNLTYYNQHGEPVDLSSLPIF